MANSRLQIEVEVDATGALKGFRMVEDAIKKTSGAAGKIAESRFDRFADGVGRFIQQPLDAAGDAASGLLKTMGPLGAGIGAAAGALSVLAVSGVTAARELGELGDQIEDTATRMGLTTREVGEFRFAMKYAGGDMSSLEGIMRKLSVGLAENSEEGKQAKSALQELGINARTSSGDLRPMSEVILDIAGALNRTEDPMNRNALAIRLLGRSALEVLPDLLELEEGVKRAKELGLAPTAADLERWEEYHKKITVADALWEKLKRNLKEQLAGTVIFTLKWVIDPLKSMTGTPPTRNIYQGSGYGELDPEMIARNEAARRLRNSTASALLGADFQRVSDTNARNQAEIDRLRARFGVSKAGIEEAYRQAARDASEARDKLFAGDISQRDTYLSKTAEANRLKAQLEAMAKAEAAAARIKRPTLIEFSTATFEVSRRSETEKAAKFAEEAIEAVEREDRIAEAIRDQILKGARDASDPLSQSLATIAKTASALPSPPAPSVEQRRTVVQSTAAARERIIELTVEPGGEVRAIQQIAAVRAGLAAQERALAVEKAKLIADEFDRTRALYDAQFEYERELFDVQQDRVQRILELRKRGEDEYVATTKRAFEALISGGRGGFESFLKAQLAGIGSTIAGNIARMTYQPGRFTLPGVGTAEKPTALGKILQGTPLGADPAKAAFDQNTTATVDNTKATYALVGALTGSGATTAPVTGLPAEITGLLGNLAGGIGNLARLIGPGGTSGFAGPLAVSKIPAVSLVPAGVPDVLSLPGFAGPLGSPPWGSFDVLNQIGKLGGGTVTSTTAKTPNIWGIPGLRDRSVSIPGLPTTTLSAAMGGGAMAAGGTAALISGINRGGVSGALGIGAGVAGIAGGILPLLSKGLAAAGPWGMAIGAGLQLASLFIDVDPKKKRGEAIDKMLEAARYEAPESMTYSMDTTGRGFDYDYRGTARVVNNITNNISAMDSQSFRDFASRNGEVISDVVDLQLTTNGALQQRVRATALPI